VRGTRAAGQRGASVCSQGAAAEAAAAFEAQDIGDILEKRTSKRVVRGGGRRGGGTFSVASFRADGVESLSAGGSEVQESADFWRALLPEAVKAAEAAEHNRNLVVGKRTRKNVNYNEDKLLKATGDRTKDASVRFCRCTGSALQPVNASSAHSHRCARSATRSATAVGSRGHRARAPAER
jgi:hypothetical protein